ncbi:MaoC family dehydratase [Oceanicola sp. 502str15]|uniref:MaoC family dehydratase n=1 Tax=Oceanicola sp. 502str15 TaxID=2696061 RepID=UPI00209633C6|nr:MaoC family dehydratase [Oceanicola sp. 502str15]MCO6383016.1 MaoC family dehydratase [Oceanicola sp. 502str15]
MVTVETAMDLAQHSGTPLGATEWMEITQEQIDAFAELTGDDHWIHVDVARAAREQPGGKTIAHGLFLISLIPRLQRQLFRIERRGAGLNYGYDRVRFTAPVPVGSLVRLVQTVTSATRRGQGTQLAISSTIEIKDSERPALVAEGLLLIGDALP